MTVQEREERQQHTQSEFQIAYAASQQRIDRNPDRSKITGALEKGLHVLVVHVPAHCPTTDAVMGTTRHYVDAFPSRTDAAISIARRYEDAHKEDRFWMQDIDYQIVSPDGTM